MKENIKKLFGKNSAIIKEYVGTFALILVSTIFFVIAERIELEDIEKFLTFTLLTGLLFFLIETLIKEKKLKSVLMFFSVVMTFISNKLLYTSEINMILLILGIYIVSFLIGIYKISKKVKTFNSYMMKLLSNGIILSISASLVQTGVLFISFVTDVLLGVEVFTSLEILMVGLFLTPGFLLTILNINNDPWRILKFLICYILLPIVLIVLLIIYVYFIGIIITLKIPTNEIYAIITALFVLACPTWILLTNYKDENKLAEKCHKIIIYSFALLIPMQIYSIGIRIYEMGITVERYFGIILIIFEIVTIILSLINKQEYLNRIILALASLIIISLCIPGINTIDMSYTSQLHIITKIYKEGTSFDNLSKKEKQTLISAYEYLVAINKKNKLPKYLNDTLKTIDYNLYENNDSEDYKYVNIHYYKEENIINVDGYKTMQLINIYGNYYKNKISFETDLDGVTDNENLYELIKTIMDVKKVTDTRIKLDDHNELEIRDLDITGFASEKINININGYLLSK